MSVAQSCLTLCDAMGCSPRGSCVHGILQARIPEWVAISFSRGIFLTQGSNPGLSHCRQILYHLSHLGRPFRVLCTISVRHLEIPRRRSPPSPCLLYEGTGIFARLGPCSNLSVYNSSSHIRGSQYVFVEGKKKKKKMRRATILPVISSKLLPFSGFVLSPTLAVSFPLLVRPSGH